VNDSEVSLMATSERVRARAEANGSDERSLVPAVTRSVAILDLVSTQRVPIGISEIARQLGFPKSSVANICSTLVDTGMMRLVDGGFRLGPMLAQLGAAYLSGIDQVRLFQEACADLVVCRDDTVQLATLTEGLDVIYLAKREGVNPVRLASAPGRSLPANCTGTGKAMLAVLDEGDVSQRLAAAGPLPKLTARSIGDRRRLVAELERIRERGYALDLEEVIEGVVCVAVAVPGLRVDGQPLAVSVTMLKPRATEPMIRKVAAELATVVDEISHGLGMTTRPASLPR
jgi:DNA-binding IclR family transcriptional regulator